MVKIGDKVKLSEACKTRMSVNSLEHIQEFGDCVGTVIGFVDYGDEYDNASQPDPDMDVRWQPSNLRYMYFRSDLELVERWKE